MNSEPRRKFDQDFKRNAVLLCAEPGRSVVEVAKNLGIGKDLLYRWRREYHRANGQYVFPFPQIPLHVNVFRHSCGFVCNGWISKKHSKTTVF